MKTREKKLWNKKIWILYLYNREKTHFVSTSVLLKNTSVLEIFVIVCFGKDNTVQGNLCDSKNWPKPCLFGLLQPLSYENRFLIESITWKVEKNTDEK